MAVKDTLPVVILPTTEAVLHDLATALVAERSRPIAIYPGEGALVYWAKYALAEVRAWRKSLPDQGYRRDLLPGVEPSDREMLLRAVRFVTLADEAHDKAYRLRWAEAYLRTLIKRYDVSA